MSTSKEAVDVEKYEFEWGKKRSVGGKNKVAQFYNSFTYDGIEYSLYDSVFLYKDGEPEPYIGKLVKIWEQEHKRKVKVLWFFRPIDIEDWLGDHETLKNELFLASGDGIGLANINPLEAIAGKCNVVCTLKDKRNPQPSAKDIENADYIFYRTFDVLNHTISDTIDGNIAGIEVKFLFNKIVQISADIPRLDAVGKEETESVVAGKDKKKEKPKSSPNLVTEDNNTPFTNLMLDETVKPRLASDGNNVKTSSESVVAGKDEKKVKPKSSTNSVVLDNNSSKELKLDDSLKPRLDSDGNVKTSSESVIAAKDEKKVKPKSSASSVAVDNKPDNSVNPRLESDGNDVKTSSESVVASNDLKGKASKEIFKSVSSKDKSLKVSSANQGNDSLPGKKIVPGTRTMSRETETALVKPEHVLNKKSIPIADSDKYEGRMAKRVLGKNENREKQESSTDLVELDNRPSKKPKLGSSVKERLDSDQNDVKEASSGSKSEENSKSKLLKVSSATTVKSIAGKDEKKDKLKSSANLVAVDNNKSSEKLKLDNSDGNDVKALSGSASEDKVKPKLVKDSLGKDKGPFNKVKPAGRTGKILNGSMSKAVPAPEKKIKPEEEPDKASWFNFSFEDEMRHAHGQGRLVLLQNLDPSYNSDQVKAIIYEAFRITCKAKVVPRTAISSPHSGQAIVILKSREEAEMVIDKLEKGCLMLPRGRPLIASPGEPPSSPGKPSTFPGHLTMELKHHTNREKTAVATSHCSQPNTLEYDMAMEWCLLQAQSDNWWKELYRQQGNELKELKTSLKQSLF